MIWSIVVAAGRGSRAGGDLPKQYQRVLGRPMIEYSVNALAHHPRIDGVMVVLAADDAHWPGWTSMAGKPVRSTTGGLLRADSVLAGLIALPDQVGEDDMVLVHDAARPLIGHAVIDALLLAEAGHGALLATPLVDTLKRADARDCAAETVPREGLWRALTPQACRRGVLTQALRATAAEGANVTDEAMALERIGLHPRLVKGATDNIKVTTAEDFALAEFLLRRRGWSEAP